MAKAQKHLPNRQSRVVRLKRIPTLAALPGNGRHRLRKGEPETPVFNGLLVKPGLNPGAGRRKRDYVGSRSPRISSTARSRDDKASS